MVKGLNSYRFFAFFAVFLFHAGAFKFGYIGVHAFFVLSGFLLTPIILEMKTHLSSKRFFINFYGRRALRIFPLYFFYLALISLVAYLAINYFHYDVGDRFARTSKQMLYALTYTYNLFAMSSAYQQTQTVTHFWSLAVEEQFYLIWPLLIFLLHKASLKKVLLGIIIAGPIIRYLLALAIQTDTGDIFNKPDITIYSFTLSNFDAFAFGGYFALYGKSWKNKSIYLYFFCLVVIGFATDYLWGIKFDLTTLGYQAFMQNGLKYLWGYSAFSLLFAVILLNIRDKKLLPLILENNTLAYLGKISYGLYVYHFPIVYFIGHELEQLQVSYYPRVIILLMLSILIASLSYHLIELRFLRAKNKFFPH